MGFVVVVIWKDNFSTVSDGVAEESTDQVSIVNYGGVTSRNKVISPFLAL